MTDTDRNLIQRAKVGDRQALGVLLRKWDRPILAVAYRLLGDRDEAADARQQTFVRVCQAIATFDEQSRFSTWLYRIAVNICRDRLRVRVVRESAMKTVVQSAGEKTSDGHTGEDSAHRKDVAKRVAAAVARLPQVQREAIALKHYAGLSFSEMAGILDVPASTLKSRVLKALQRLAIELPDVG